MAQAKWIWYPGSFELYHGMLLMNRRTSTKSYANGTRKSVYYYPMWRVDGPKRNAILYKEADIDREEVIEFYSNCPDACISVDGLGYPPASKILLRAGHHRVYVSGFKAESFPAFYIKGNVFASDRTYLVAPSDEYAGRHAGYSDLYTDLEDRVEDFKFKYKMINPVSKKRINGGILFDFGKEVFGEICVAEGSDYIESIDLYLGESNEEALDTAHSELMAHLVLDDSPMCTKPMAFRYVFIPNTDKSIDLFMNLEYLPLENRGEFKCDNEEINKLWDVCAYTMLLNSREGFFDGIKRDRWVWSGDAYQSYLVNYYLACDKDIVRRTVRMLRGSDPIKKHINTICDYTFLWLCSIWDYYFYTGDKAFLEDIYPDMLDILSFVEGRLDKSKMYERKSDDWVFIDWSTFDSNGPMCAEQMLLCRAFECVGKCASVLGDKKISSKCKKRVDYMIEQINLLYWNDDKCAFIDDYASGKNNVTRHANIFALLFDYTTKERKEKITKNVIFNKEITPITTPYFEFYELDAMCQLGNFEYFTNMLDSYWGGMLRLGATTIWEEFDPTKSGIEHYEMYGGKYEKSLCHAWGASPIYLLGKYALGVVPTKAGFEGYTVTPNLMGFGEIEGKVPTPQGEIYVKVDKNEISVLSPIDGGTLIYKGKKHKIKKDEMLTIKA